ncbi:MAG: glutamine-hydrolyzing carbamoyl-phosphate synthase small subunit [Polyangiaceae bacterium]|nr:glutamine-hydrolyzing carbamoyl-phosphate synthase small subunit [Polyangiaceae bacterium]
MCLADGSCFAGVFHGATEASCGEVVFTTGMTGYEEVLTDPSYTGQIVCMTAPHIGNTGINAEDVESVSGRPQVAGLVVRELAPAPSSWRSTESLGAWLARHGVALLSGVDTRSLTRHLRDHGAQNGAIGTGPAEELVERARRAPRMEGLDLVARVSPREPYAFDESSGRWLPSVGAPALGRGGRPGERGHVVVIDLGIKRNILRCLCDAGFRVTAVPARSTAVDILAYDPDGVFVSNGPGDPAAVTYAIDTLRALLGKKPLFGICLGHQLLALAAGARTYKLKFGHRGVNQPVKDLATGRVEVTTQNHGFAVDLGSLPAGVRTTHLHLNDGTSEGLELRDARAFSVQYHPEAAAGPHDALYLFERFAALVEAARA